MKKKCKKCGSTNMELKFIQSGTRIDMRRYSWLSRFELSVFRKKYIYMDGKRFDYAVCSKEYMRNRCRNCNSKWGTKTQEQMRRKTKGKNYKSSYNKKSCTGENKYRKDSYSNFVNHVSY